MTHQDSFDGAGRGHPGPEMTPRLRLKRKAPSTGYVDGAWWPRSDDLPTELRDLLAVLSVRLGAVTRVTYHIGEWATPPSKCRVGEQVVRLDGYRLHPPHTVGVLDGRGHEIDLLVVPSQTEAETAHGIMMAAAAADNVSAVDLLLAGAPRTPDTLSA